MVEPISASKESLNAAEPKPIPHSPAPNVLEKSPVAPSGDLKLSNSLTKTVWEHYVDRASLVDLEMVQDWNQNMDVLLLFATLFSAIITSFVLQTLNMLQEDNGDEMKAILYRVSSQLANSSVAPIMPPMSTGVSGIAIAINALFMAGLCSSVMAALGAMLVKQWVYEYHRGIKGQSSPKVHALWRHFRYEGLERWPLQEIVVSLPVFMHVSIAMFFVGLIFFVWSKSTVVAWIIAGFFIVTALVYIATTTSPIFRIDSPFRTPMASAWMSGIEALAKKMGKGYKKRFQMSLVAREGRAVQNDQNIGRRSVAWLLRHTPDTYESAPIFISAIKILTEIKALDLFQREEHTLWQRCLRNVCNVIPLSDWAWSIPPQMSNMWSWKPSSLVLNAAETLLQMAVEIPGEPDRQFDDLVAAYIHDTVMLFTMPSHDRKLRVLGFKAASMHFAPSEINEMWEAHLNLIRDCIGSPELTSSLNSLRIGQLTLRSIDRFEPREVFKCGTTLRVMCEVLDSNPSFDILAELVLAVAAVYGEELSHEEDVLTHLEKLVRVIDDHRKSENELGLSVPWADCLGFYSSTLRYLLRQTTEDTAPLLVMRSEAFTASQFTRCLLGVFDMMKVEGPAISKLLSEYPIFKSLNLALKYRAGTHALAPNEELLINSLRCANHALSICTQISLPSTPMTIPDLFWQFIGQLDEATSKGDAITINPHLKVYLATFIPFFKDLGITIQFDMGYQFKSPIFLVDLCTIFMVPLPLEDCLDVFDDNSNELWRSTEWTMALQNRCTYGIPKPSSEADGRLLRAMLLSNQADMAYSSIRAAMICKLEPSIFQQVLAVPALKSSLSSFHKTAPVGEHNSTELLHTLVIGWKFLVDSSIFAKEFVSQGGIDWLDGIFINDDSYILLIRITGGLGPRLSPAQGETILKSRVYNSLFEIHRNERIQKGGDRGVAGLQEKEMTRWEQLMVVMVRSQPQLCDEQRFRMAQSIEAGIRSGLFPPT